MYNNCNYPYMQNNHNNNCQCTHMNDPYDQCHNTCDYNHNDHCYHDPCHPGDPHNPHNPHHHDHGYCPPPHHPPHPPKPHPYPERGFVNENCFVLNDETPHIYDAESLKYGDFLDVAENVFTKVTRRPEDSRINLAASIDMSGEIVTNTSNNYFMREMLKIQYDELNGVLPIIKSPIVFNLFYHITNMEGGLVYEGNTQVTANQMCLHETCVQDYFINSCSNIFVVNLPTLDFQGEYVLHVDRMDATCNIIDTKSHLVDDKLNKFYMFDDNYTNIIMQHDVIDKQEKDTTAKLCTMNIGYQTTFNTNLVTQLKMSFIAYMNWLMMTPNTFEVWKILNDSTGDAIRDLQEEVIEIHTDLEDIKPRLETVETTLDETNQIVDELKNAVIDAKDVVFESTSIDDEDNTPILSTNVQDAIVEVNTRIDNIKSASIPYNNEKSILEAENVQDAIDEVAKTIAVPDADHVAYKNDVSGLTAVDVQQAIDEIAGAVYTPNASEVIYDNTESGLTSTTVQASIDEINDSIHYHDNMETLNGITDAKVTEWDAFYATRHSHTNKEALDAITKSDIELWTSSIAYNHKHTNKDLLDTIDDESQIHSHANKELLDTITTETQIHDHINKTVIDDISADDVTNWQSAYTDSHVHTNFEILNSIEGSDIVNWNGKEDAFVKNTAFNKNFATSLDEVKAGGTASLGTSENVARADHVHPSSDVHDIEGNANTATKLQNAVSINGETFDGTQNITIDAELVPYDNEQSSQYLDSMENVTSVQQGVDALSIEIHDIPKDSSTMPYDPKYSSLALNTKNVQSAIDELNNKVVELSANDIEFDDTVTKLNVDNPIEDVQSAITVVVDNINDLSNVVTNITGSKNITYDDTNDLSGDRTDDVVVDNVQDAIDTLANNTHANKDSIDALTTKVTQNESNITNNNVALNERIDTLTLEDLMSDPYTANPTDTIDISIDDENVITVSVQQESIGTTHLETTLSELISTTSQQSHTHTNASVLNDISAEDVTNWNGKEDAFTKNTAFNKNFATSIDDVKANGTKALGTSENVARADHVHPLQVITDIEGNANTATSLQDPVNINNIPFDGSTAIDIAASNIEYDGTDIVGSDATNVSGVLFDLSEQINDINVIDTADGITFDTTVSDLTASESNVQTVIDHVIGRVTVLEETGPSSVTAEDVSYDNTSSQLTATTVQSAIDEIKPYTGYATETTRGTARMWLVTDDLGATTLNISTEDIT